MITGDNNCLLVHTITSNEAATVNNRHYSHARLYKVIEEKKRFNDRKYVIYTYVYVCTKAVNSGIAR